MRPKTKRRETLGFRAFFLYPTSLPAGCSAVPLLRSSAYFCPSGSPAAAGAAGEFTSLVLARFFSTSM